MKYAASLVALAGLGEAVPMPQFSIPGFSIPSFSIPTGLPFPIPTGGGFSLPGFSGIPSLGGGLPSVTGGLSLPTGALSIPTTAAAAPTATGLATQPTATTSSGSGIVGADCTAQSSSGGSTENGVADKNCCTDLTVIFARGTSEPGNVGIIAGPPMFKSLRSKLGADRVTIQGVDYPADAAGNANLGASGGPAMASSVKAALSHCPESKIIVSGYSQGAMVVHNAFSQGISASNVVGAILFGDPLKTQSVGGLSSDKVKEFCGTTDAICGTGTDPTGDHLSYGAAADEAATFAISVAGLS